MPWIITREHQMFRRVGNEWRALPGRFSEVAIGANYAVWALGPPDARTQGGYPIYHWTGTEWKSYQGAAMRIAVDPKGSPWIVNDSYVVMRLTDSYWWQDVPGRASDLSIGADGSLWGLAAPDQKMSGGYPLLRWKGNDWERFQGAAIRLTVDPKGMPWVVNDTHQAFRLEQGAYWMDLPGLCTELSVGADGTVWALGRGKDGSPVPIVNWDGKKWIALEPPPKPAAAPASGVTVSGVTPPPRAERAGPPVTYCRSENTWRKLSGRVQEITIERDGSAWVRFEDGERIPLPSGGEIFVGDDKTRGMTVQINVQKSLTSN
jgi:hypothetical protein